MANNVWKWCADWYDEEYYKKSPQVDPMGPKKGAYRVILGSAITNSSGKPFTVSDRFQGISSYSNCNLVGFRVVALET